MVLITTQWFVGVEKMPDFSQLEKKDPIQGDSFIPVLNPRRASVTSFFGQMRIEGMQVVLLGLLEGSTNSQKTRMPTDRHLMEDLVGILQM